MIDRLRFTGRLHDLGKIVYAINPLVKPGTVIEVAGTDPKPAFCLFQSEGEAQTLAEALQLPLELLPVSDTVALLQATIERFAQAARATEIVPYEPEANPAYQFRGFNRYGWRI